MLSTHQIAADLEKLLAIQIGSYDNLPPHGSPNNKYMLLSTLLADIKLVQLNHNLINLGKLNFSVTEYEDACLAEIPAIQGHRKKINAYGRLVIHGAISLLNNLDKQRTKEKKLLLKMEKIALNSEALKEADSKLNDNALVNNSSATTISTAKPHDEKVVNGNDSSNPAVRTAIQSTLQPPLKPISNASFTTVFGASAIDSDPFSLDDLDNAEEEAKLSIVITSSDGVQSNHQMR